MKRSFYCDKRQFILPSYKCYTDFTNFDGVVEIIWQAKTDFHATLKLKSNLDYTKDWYFNSNCNNLLD
jgi:hypothetical protein